MGQSDSPTDDGSDDEGATETVTTSFDPGADDQPVESVVEAVAAVRDVDETELEPLFEALDPDALERLFEPGPRSTQRSPNGTVSFRFAGCTVTVHADGRTVASPASSERR